MNNKVSADVIFPLLTACISCVLHKKLQWLPQKIASRKAKKKKGHWQGTFKTEVIVDITESDGPLTFSLFKHDFFKFHVLVLKKKTFTNSNLLSLSTVERKRSSQQTWSSTAWKGESFKRCRETQSHNRHYHWQSGYTGSGESQPNCCPGVLLLLFCNCNT